MRSKLQDRLHLRPFRNNKGMALIIAIMAVVLIMYLAMEVTYDSTVEYTVNSQAINRIKAYYSAKSGLQVALLRVKLYQQAKAQFGSQLGSNASLLENIWKFPFVWPLQPMPGMNTVDVDSMNKLVGESLMDGTYEIKISEEGSKIDLADLVSKVEGIRNATKRQLLNIFESKTESDQEFAAKYQSADFINVLDNIADWMSSSNTSIKGGDKRSAFSAMPKEDGSNPTFPPNRPFRSIDELRLVPGMNEDFFSLIAPVVTIFGSRTINPNTASKEILMSLDKGITEEIASEIQKRQGDEANQFNCQGKGEQMDFWQFVSDKGARIDNPNLDQIPISCSTSYTFRISANGVYGGANKQINVIVTDINQVAKTIVEMNKKNAAKSTPDTASNPETKKDDKKSTNTQEPLPKGPPRIVYWSEK